MKLTIVTGRAGSGKTARCLGEMRQRLAQSAEGHALFMILPEHATFKMEKALAGSPGLDGFTRGCVFGFKRLAHRILMETGGALRPRITDVGKRLLLAKALGAHAKNLKALGRAARQRNFAESLAAMIEEFKSYRIEAGDLELKAAGLDDSPLKDKLSDLSLIYRSFTASMEGRYADGEDFLDLAAAKMHLSEMMRGAEVWIDAFIFFNPQETAILRAILKRAKSVTITLCIDDPNDAAHRQETSPFHRQWKTYGKLKEIAGELGASVEEIACAGNLRFKSPSLAHIERNLYRFPLAILPGETGVQIVEAANRRLEVEAVAADMIRLCREEGYRWRDLGVLARDRENYEELLETVFQDYDIPFFSDNKRKSAHHPLAELLRSALEAVRTWRYEPLFRCFKTDFFDAERRQIDDLENYVLEFGIRGSRWRMDEDWTYVKRLSLDEEDETGAAKAERLAQINATRRKVAAPLLRFEERMKRAQNAAAMTEALYELLVDLDAAQTLENWALAAERAGALDEALEHRQLWEAIIGLFDQLVETSGEEKLSPDAFDALVGDALEALTLSLIPPGLDYATIASFDQNSLDNTPAIYIIGASEGILPRRARGEGLLSDDDRARLAELGISLPSGAGGDNFAERYLIYSALTRATRYLWISYPLADSEGGGLKPSPIAGRVREMLALRKIESIPLSPAYGDEKRLIARPRQAVSKLAGALGNYKRDNRLAPIWRDVYNWARDEKQTREILRAVLAGLFHRAEKFPLRRALAGKLFARHKRLKGSVTRFERFRACPFRHFAEYGLRLKERCEYRFSAPDLGQFLHAALKAYGDRMAEEGRRWGDLDDEQSKAVCAQIVEKLAPKLQNEILLSTAKYQHLLGRIRRTVERSVQRLAEFDRVSAFKPAALEKSFGRGTFDLAAPIYDLGDGYRLEISGQIDRIDAMEEEGKRYFLVIDYKSGGAYINLIDVYYGLRLQLLTYLLVAWNSSRELLGQKALPAGILYCFLKNPTLNEPHKIPKKSAAEKIGALLKMPGWILADVDMIRKIDSSFKFVKVSVTSKGAIHAASLSSVKTEEEFMALLAYTERVLVDTGKQILAGDVEAAPFLLEQREPCAYCPFAPLCQFDRSLPESNYRELKKIAPDDIMKEIVAAQNK